MRRLSIKVALLFVLVAAIAPFGSAATTTTPFTLPAKTPKTQVKCTGCTGAAKNLPSVGYQGAITSFAGRFLDSTYVGDWQGPIRTLRAWQMKYDSVHDRIYMRLGSLFVAYDGATFISRLLAGERLLDASTANRPPSATAEKYLNPDRQFYPETESTWNQGRPDGQDYMPDFDYDDRGYVYLACRVLWGIIKDDYGKGGGATLQAITQVLDASEPPGAIMSVKTTDGRYFVIVGSGAGSSDVYDVSTPTAPVKTGLSRGIAASSSAKTTDQHWVAVIEGTNLEIFTPEALVTNGSPTKTLTAPAGAYRGVATDGTNFFSAIQSGSTTIISVLSQSGGTWTEQKISTGLSFTPGAIHYGDSSLSVRGDSDIHVFRVSGTTPSDLDLAGFQPGVTTASRYFPTFYSASFVPAGYLAPAQINFYDALVYRTAGKSYLIANLKGLGDVYDITVPAPSPVTTLSISADKVSPQPEGTPIAFTAVAGGSPSPEYRFWRSDSPGQWTMVQDYSPASTWTWATAPGSVGSRQVEVDARTSGTTVAYDKVATMPFVITPATAAKATVTSLTASVASPQTVGSEITFTAMATGGTPPLQYRFFRFDNGSWTMVRDFTTSNTWTWTAATSAIGLHRVEVDVRSAGGVLHESVKEVQYAITPCRGNQ